MNRLLLGATALIVIVVTGVIHGLETGRWGANSELKNAALRIVQIPSIIGDWSSTDQQMDPQQLQVAGAVGYVARVYVNRLDGSSVNVVLLCGPPGPMSVHPPTVCFTGAGWGLTGSTQQRTFKAKDGALLGEFWQGNFTRDVGGIPVSIRTFWSWGTSGDWQATTAPRRAFAGKRLLYKLYLTVNGTERPETVSGEHVEEFARLFLPSVKTIMNSGS